MSYPTAPLAPSLKIEEGLEKTFIDINKFETSNNKLQEMITYFKDEKRDSKKKNESIKYHLLL